MDFDEEDFFDDDLEQNILWNFYDAGSCRASIRIASYIILMIKKFKEADLDPELFLDLLEKGLKINKKKWKKELKIVEKQLDLDF